MNCHPILNQAKIGGKKAEEIRTFNVRRLFSYPGVIDLVIERDCRPDVGKLELKTDHLSPATR